MQVSQLKVSFTVYVSTQYDAVDKAITILKSHGFNAIMSCEANKPYAIKIETTMQQAINAMDVVAEILNTKAIQTLA